MGVKEVVMGMSLWVALNGVCQAEPAMTEGVIRFTGSIVEPGCRTDMNPCLLYTSPSPRDLSTSRMPSSA